MVENTKANEKVVSDLVLRVKELEGEVADLKIVYDELLDTASTNEKAIENWITETSGLRDEIDDLHNQMEELNDK